jgi:hypothetical protein
MARHRLQLKDEMMTDTAERAAMIDGRITKALLTELVDDLQEQVEEAEESGRRTEYIGGVHSIAAECLQTGNWDPTLGLKCECCGSDQGAEVIEAFIGRLEDHIPIEDLKHSRENLEDLCQDVREKGDEPVLSDAEILAGLERVRAGALAMMPSRASDPEIAAGMKELAEDYRAGN